MTRDPEKRRQYNQRYHAKLEAKIARKNRDQTPEGRERQRNNDAKRRTNPNFKIQKAAYQKAYKQRPEVRTRLNAISKAWIAKPANVAKRKAWFSTVRGRAVRMYHQSKRRAKKLSLSFNLTIEFIEAQLLGNCPYTKQPFYIGPDRRNPWCPSNDRIDNSKGYTTDNVQVVSLWWNIAKNEWPLEVNQMAIQGLTSCNQVAPGDM